MTKTLLEVFAGFMKLRTEAAVCRFCWEFRLYLCCSIINVPVVRSSALLLSRVFEKVFPTCLPPPRGVVRPLLIYF